MTLWNYLSTQVIPYVAILSTEGCGKAVKYSSSSDQQIFTQVSQKLKKLKNSETVLREWCPGGPSIATISM
jgi:hypothetical protein